MSEQSYKTFMKTIGYTFKDVSMLENALTHSSYINECKMPYYACNERLEFLGDAVLELASSRFLFQEHPKMPEGDMTTLRASLVCELSLAKIARQIDLGNHLRLGKGEKKTGGADRDSILSDAFEAVVGAMYLDGGFDVADTFIKKFVLTEEGSKDLFNDAKSRLQEVIQDKHHENTFIRYEVVEETGPAHDKIFKVKCIVQGEEMSFGEGHTKKKAEQQAALIALEKIREHK